MKTDGHDTNALAAYIDGRLGEGERSQLVAHLAECVECRGTLAAFARASASAGARGTGKPFEPRSWFGRPAVWLPVAASLTLATVVGITVLRLNDEPQPSVPAAHQAPAAQPPAPSSVPPSPVPAPAPIVRPSPAPPRPTPAAPVPRESLLPKRGGERRVGGKTFRLEAGDWLDTAYDPLAALPVVEARTEEARASLVARIPALREFAALGNRVVVVHEGTVYKIGPIRE